MENQIFQQLMLDDPNVMLSDEQKDFVITHKQIVACGSMAGQYLVEMAYKLKHMRDGKLYRRQALRSSAIMLSRQSGSRSGSVQLHFLTEKTAAGFSDKKRGPRHYQAVYFGGGG